MNSTAKTNQIGLTKPQFANLCRGALLRFSVNGQTYRLQDRCGRKLVMVRINPCASASLCEVVSESQRFEWSTEVTR